jgi:hypothetical protein
VPGDETPDHHGSHRGLLRSAAEVPADALDHGVDAVVVPTARPPAYLDEAAALARQLNCALVTLHSKRWTSAAGAAGRVPADVDLIAIDVPAADQLNLPAWETSRLLAGTVFARRTDLSAKRNLALLLSHLLDWSRVLFLDDDITRLNPDDVRRAGSLLAAYNAVGLNIGGFPDNSVVCHANRETGGQQQTFVGGGALTVNVRRSRSFFPDIYNEDWFFLLDGDKALQPVAVMGAVRQYPYDPFRSPERARGEELGDVLAEGIYRLLDQGQSIIDADTAYWAWYLRHRRKFITGVLQQVVDNGALKPSDSSHRIEALKGALGRLALITPDLCKSYLQAWAADQGSWQRHLAGLPSGVTRQEALAALARPGALALSSQIRRPGAPAGIPVTLPALAAGPSPQVLITSGAQS